MDNKETLKRVGGGVLNSALAGGLLWLLSHGAAEGRAIQPISQVPPPPKGIVEEFKGPMPSQQPLTEQVEQIRALQGPTLRGQEGEQTAETIKTDILITGIDFDSNGNPWVLARHPSKNDAQMLYKGTYDQENTKFTFGKLAEFSWKETAALGGVAVSPVNPDILAVGGWVNNSPYEGKVVISTDGGRTFQEIPIAGMGGVNHLAFSKNGDKLYLSVNNTEASFGIVKKVNVDTMTREAVANNGLDGQQSLGGPILPSSNYEGTLYAVSGIEPAILRTQDGGQNWEKLFNLPSPVDSKTLINWQGKDTLLVAGNGWLKIWQEGGQLQHIVNEGGLNVAVDPTGVELKIYRTSGTNRIKTGGIDSSSWESWGEFSTTGLPPNKEVKNLKFVTAPDGRKLLVAAIQGVIQPNVIDSSGFWGYDLSQGNTTGSWQQMVEGLEWKDPLPIKRYFPFLVNKYSGGW